MNRNQIQWDKYKTNTLLSITPLEKLYKWSNVDKYLPVDLTFISLVLIPKNIKINSPLNNRPKLNIEEITWLSKSAEKNKPTDM